MLIALLAMNTSAQVPQDLFTPFETLLETSVENGVVNYPAFAASSDFARMIGELKTATLPSRADKNTRLAFYINAYNAVSIQGILDGYSPSTVWSRLRFFKRRKYDLFDTSLTLFALEHERIINEGDPRIHFAIVCASKSCPPLMSELYVADTLDAQLDTVAANFINNRNSNAFDAGARSAELSRIFKWYEDEFAAEAGSLKQYLARYIRDPDLKMSLENDDWSFSFKSYDWSLNGTSINR